MNGGGRVYTNIRSWSNNNKKQKTRPVDQPRLWTGCSTRLTGSTAHASHLGHTDHVAFFCPFFFPEMDRGEPCPLVVLCCHVVLCLNRLSSYRDFQLHMHVRYGRFSRGRNMNIQLRCSSRPGISYRLQQLMHDLKTTCSYFSGNWNLLDQFLVWGRC